MQLIDSRVSTYFCDTPKMISYRPDAALKKTVVDLLGLMALLNMGLVFLELVRSRIYGHLIGMGEVCVNAVAPSVIGMQFDIVKQ